jgi:hypothetical protein
MLVCTVIRIVSISAKFDLHRRGTLVEAHIRSSAPKAYFSFKKCPIYRPTTMQMPKFSTT